MDSKNRSIVIAILIAIAATIISTLCAWVRVERLERELAAHKTEAYIFRLVQEELLKQHGLHLDIKFSNTKGEAAPSIDFERDNANKPEESNNE